MKLIALDTTSDGCTCALYVDGEVHEVGSVAPRRHAELVLSLISGLLAEAEIPLGGLDGLAFGRGPGSFTGVRIGAGVVQGLAFGADLPVAPISSLRALAQAVYRERGETRVVTALDARMDEVYWAGFELAEDGLMAPVVGECVCAPERVPLPGGAGWFGAGSGWIAHAARLRGRLGARVAETAGEGYPRARDVAVLGAAVAARGEMVEAERALPVYLRDRVTVTPAAGG